MDLRMVNQNEQILLKWKINLLWENFRFVFLTSLYIEGLVFGLSNVCKNYLKNYEKCTIQKFTENWEIF